MLKRNITKILLEEVDNILYYMKIEKTKNNTFSDL